MKRLSKVYDIETLVRTKLNENFMQRCKETSTDILQIEVMQYSKLMKGKCQGTLSWCIHDAHLQSQMTFRMLRYADVYTQHLQQYSLLAYHSTEVWTALPATQKAQFRSHTDHPDL